MVPRNYYIWLVVALIFPASFALPFTTLSFIQNVGTNLLFRGPEPMVLDHFDLEGLTLEMELIAFLEGFKFPTKFYFVDFCLLQVSTTDKGDEKIERQYFEEYPDAGKFCWWPTNGTKLMVYDYNVSTVRRMVQAWDESSKWIDPLPKWMKTVHMLLQAKHELPYVLYLHCMGGKDRTGELAGSYYMQFMNMTLKQATYLDQQIAGRRIGTSHQHAMEWYCFYLKYVLNYDHLTCKNPYS